MDSESPDTIEARRPIKARGAAWASAAAVGLTNRGVSPNSISVSSVVFAGLAAAAMIAGAGESDSTWSALYWVLAAVGIQMRLIANLLDGMVAVEGGKGGKLGDLFNEFPDRIADCLVLLAAGVVAANTWSPFEVSLGWPACLLALLCAYTRALGANCGAGQAFHGPMAKPHRMFLLTCACLAAAVPGTSVEFIFAGALWGMIGGMLVTVVRRLASIRRNLLSA